MKKKFVYTYIGMSLSFFTLTTTYGQSGTEVPRLTPEEQAAFEMSVPLNQAKLPDGNLVDPKMDPVLSLGPGPTNWKPDPVVADARMVNELDGPGDMRKTDQTWPVVNRTQPEGAKPVGETMNRREISGPRQQPDAPNSGIELRPRNLNGSRTQPEGDKPVR